MQIKIPLHITEGTVYDALKSSANDFIKALPSVERDRTGTLADSFGIIILRNGAPISDEQMRELREQPIGTTKLAAAIMLGGHHKALNEIPLNKNLPNIDNLSTNK